MMDSDQEFLSNSDFSDDDISDKLFGPVSSNSTIDSCSLVEFQSFNFEAVYKVVQEQAQSVSDILGIPMNDSKVLLVMYKWDRDELVDKFTRGINYSEENNMVEFQTSTTCPICGDDEVFKIFRAEECGHEFCVECFQHYLTDKIKGCEIVIECPSACRVSIGPDKFELILDPQILELFHRQIVIKYVEDHHYLKWCTFPDCNQIIECRLPADLYETTIPSVKCANEHRLCFGCGNKDHLPAPCSIAKKWLQKCSDDSETVNWMAAKTKLCPKCNVAIEKNGGCNHMTCKKCQYHVLLYSFLVLLGLLGNLETTSRLL